MSSKNIEKKPSNKKKITDHPADLVPAEFYPTFQSLEEFVADLNGTGLKERSPLGKAQEIMYDAWEAPTRRQALKLARKALKVSEDCADAYSFLAEESAKTLDEAIELYEKGVEAGKRALGEEAFRNGIGCFWGLLETRPYMRARAGLAECLWESGQREKAVDNYWDLLRLNPNDNQGLRYLLMPRLIELGRDKDAERLYRKSKDDGMAAWMYSRVLLDFRKHGVSVVAEKSLAKALAANRHVPAYLLGLKKMPRFPPDRYGVGDDSEAVLYVHENFEAWVSTPGALEWFAGFSP